jgi:hypothetical protein
MKKGKNEVWKRSFEKDPQQWHVYPSSWGCAQMGHFNRP